MFRAVLVVISQRSKRVMEQKAPKFREIYWLRSSWACVEGDD